LKRFQGYSTTSTWPVRWIDDRVNRRLDWFRSSFIQSWEDVSRDKITTGTFERVKMGADHHTTLRMRPHHVTSRSAPCILQFVRLDRWRSLTRFLHSSYHYHWSRDHPCSLPLLRDSLFVCLFYSYTVPPSRGGMWGVSKVVIPSSVRLAAPSTWFSVDIVELSKNIKILTEMTWINMLLNRRFYCYSSSSSLSWSEKLT
jgi:hypothetical protein